MRLFRYSDVSRVFPDIPARTLRYWTEAGLLNPEQKADGPGTRRQYSTRNMVEIGLISELVSYGMPHLFITGIMMALSKENLNESDGFDCVIVSNRLRLTANPLGVKMMLSNFDTWIGKMGDFKAKTTELIFNEKEGLSARTHTISSVIINLAEIWEYVRSKI